MKTYLCWVWPGYPWVALHASYPWGGHPCKFISSWSVHVILVHFLLVSSCHRIVHASSKSTLKCFRFLPDPRLHVKAPSRPVLCFLLIPGSSSECSVTPGFVNKNHHQCARVCMRRLGGVKKTRRWGNTRNGSCWKKGQFELILQIIKNVSIIL